MAFLNYTVQYKQTEMATGGLLTLIVKKTLPKMPTVTASMVTQ